MELEIVVTGVLVFGAVAYTVNKIVSSKREKKKRKEIARTQTAVRVKGSGHNVEYVNLNNISGLTSFEVKEKNAVEDEIEARRRNVAPADFEREYYASWSEEKAIDEKSHSKIQQSIDNYKPNDYSDPNPKSESSVFSSDSVTRVGGNDSSSSSSFGGSGGSGGSSFGSDSGGGSFD